MTAPTIQARPEFLRRGTPVVLGRLRLTVVSELLPPLTDTERKAITARTGISGAVLDGPTCIAGPTDRHVPVQLLAVDLSDATGRAHVDWALSKKRCAGLGPDHWSHNDPRLGGGYGAQGHASGYPEVIAALDPNDDTRLPDGSRLVDALALKLVAEHVFGMEAP